MNYFYNERKEKSSFAVKVAECGVRKALRPWLKHGTVSYVAVLVVPDASHLRSYREAGIKVMQDGGDEDRDHDFSVESFDNAGGNASVFRSLSNREFLSRNIVFVTDGDEHVPESLRLAADFVLKVQPPTTGQFAAAALKLGLGNVSKGELEFLTTVSFSRLVDVMTPGRLLSSAVRRLRELAAVEASAEAEAKSNGGTDATGHMPLLDLHGYGPAKDWGVQLACDVNDWREGNITWDEVDRGALLSGPPGCGKTTFASVLAQSCGMALVTTSAAQWQAAGHLGDMLRAMRSSFEQAKKQAPCVLFLDELDSIGNRATLDTNSDYRRQVVNALLECLDGAVARDGVVVVGATNFPQLVDPAVLRPGRLDVHLAIPLPDRGARMAILRQHLRTDNVTVDLGQFADLSEGFTGAMIEKVARDARRLARREDCEPMLGEVLMSMPGRRMLTEEERWRVAVHEAGHAVVGTLVDTCRLEEVKVSDWAALGIGVQSVGQTVFLAVSPLLQTADYMRDEIAMLMGGLLAEEACFGNFTAGVGGMEGSDLAVATDLATAIEAVMGMGSSLVSETVRDPARLSSLRTLDPLLRQRVERCLVSERDRARGLIDRHKPTVEALARLLMAKKRVDGSEVQGMLRQYGCGASAQNSASVAT